MTVEEDIWAERKEHYELQPEDKRSSYDVDYARIIHSASFRRLQGKTQILNLGDSDFYRTRLTHSLEVSQIATGIVRQLSGTEQASVLPGQSLIQAISLTHDLGHPPFGHGGEVALNYCMREHGGFEGNGHTLRTLTKLERFSKEAGANLSRRVLLGVLKYPVSYSQAKNPKIEPKLAQSTDVIRIIDREASIPPKCYLDSEKDIVDWILEPLGNKDRHLFSESMEKTGKHNKALHKSFDCSIMDIADDIAYGVHDLEDAIALRLVTEKAFLKDVPYASCSKFIEVLQSKYPDEFEKNADEAYASFVNKLFAGGDYRKRQIGRLVHNFITNVEVYEHEQFENKFLSHRVRMHEDHDGFLSALKSFIVNRVIKSPNVQHLEFKGQQMVVSVFEAIASEPEQFLPLDAQKRLTTNQDVPRVICDYVAGMTDEYLLKTYDRLFSPHMGSVFDKL